jgi:5-methylcytosine-specific restriction enzyme A
MIKDDFINWLESNTNLSAYSIRRYAGAIETLSTELKVYGLNTQNLFYLKDKEIIDIILKNSVF